MLGYGVQDEEFFGFWSLGFILCLGLGFMVVEIRVVRVGRV